jgi:hypothetical protein
MIWYDTLFRNLKLQSCANLLVILPFLNNLTIALKHRSKAYFKRTQINRFKRVNKRNKAKEKKRSGFYRYYFAIISTAKVKGRKLEGLPRFQVYNDEPTYQNIGKPAFSDNIQFLATSPGIFDRSAMNIPEDGMFVVPNPFSFTTNFDESFLFLKRLFYALYKDVFQKVTLDYTECEQVDIDASMCMDILLDEFIDYFKKCNKRRLKTKLKEIVPINFQKESVAKTLFSIGTFRNIGRTQIKRDDIIPFHLIKGDNFASDAGEEREKELTKMVDYIVARCEEMNRTLTWQAENRLSKVIGEVLVNAAEHSGRKFRYAIGYFEKKKNGDSDIGIFNFSILSFGKTIYENFKNPEAEGWHTISRMKELSEGYTSRHWFKAREFEEETLWTLYALQEGVTSVRDKKRGNGSINFIESFFSLKGSMEDDHSSFLTIMSGNTRITFDGKYQIVEKQRGTGETPFKMMTFNDSGSIEDRPDPKYVTFADNFFPGTLITAKICINFNNIEKGGEHA